MPEAKSQPRRADGPGKKLVVPSPLSRVIVFVPSVKLVAQRAAIVEPALEANWRAGRTGTLRVHRTFWAGLSGDGLLDPALDIGWLAETTALLGGAETYLSGRHLFRWSITRYERWLVTGFLRLAGLE